MKTTTQQDRDFIEDVIDANTFLEKSIMWIQNNLNPADVFKEQTLREWALLNMKKEDFQ